MTEHSTLLKRAFRASFSVLLACSAFAGESRPTSQGDIQKAVERAKLVRAQKKLVPNVLQSSALLMKIGDVRCGQALFKIEDAKGENGAAYKLSERFKAGMSENGQSALIDYSGTFFLAADLTLVSGELQAKSNLLSKSDNKKQAVVSRATLIVKDNTLAWERSEQKDGKDSPKSSRKIALHGVRPMPKNALLALSALVMESEKDGWKPDPKNALCVPVIDLGWEMDSFDVEPAWVSFDQPAYTHAKGSAAVMRVRSLVGEVTDKGLEIEPPLPQVWLSVQLWALDGKAHALSHPAPEDPRIKIEIADPASLDIESPLEMDAIERAMSASAAKPEKK
jgi:hypothetical protein